MLINNIQIMCYHFKMIVNMDHQMNNLPVFNQIILLYNNNKINNYNKINKIMLIWI